VWHGAVHPAVLDAADGVLAVRHVHAGPAAFVGQAKCVLGVDHVHAASVGC